MVQADCVDCNCVDCAVALTVANQTRTLEVAESWTMALEG